MLKKNKIDKAIILSMVLLLETTACAPPNAMLNPSASPLPNNVVNNTNKDPIINQNPQPNSPTTSNPTPNNNTDTTNNTTSIVIPPASISINGLNLTSGRPGETIVLKGTNFISGKTKNILFLNSMNQEVAAEVSKVTENEITFKIPERSDSTGVSKVILITDSGLRVSVGDFTIGAKLQDTVYSNGSSFSGGGGGGGSFTPTPTAAPVDPETVGTIAGNVFQNIDLGGFKIQADDLRKAVSNVKITVRDKDGKELGTTLSDTAGAYSLNVPAGSGYYLEFTKDGMTSSKYYGIGDVVLKTITSVEQ